MTDSIYAIRSSQIIGIETSGQIMSALLHGMLVTKLQFQRGSGHCIPYIAMIKDNQLEFVPSYGDWEVK